MSQEYTVKQWKPWENEEGLIRDLHGNYKGSVLFEEDSTEPIDATFKNQPNIGDKKYGSVSEYKTKAGKLRRGFKSAPRLDVQQPQQPQRPTGATGSSDDYWSDKDAGIKAQFAIKAAVQALGVASPEDVDYIHSVEAYAKQFFAMVDRVKVGTRPKSSEPEFKASDIPDFDEPVSDRDF